MARASLTTRRLLGLDRSGGPPPETTRGQPLNPWTIPNAIGFARLALIPVFLALALSSGDGREAEASIVYAVIGGSDYLDGIAARVTGQYSRFGALLDPLVDRLLVVAGVAVCWRFELLPRWLLAVLVARELFMLVASRAWLRRGLELRINWPGRAAVWPTMSAIVAGLCGLETLGTVLLALGVALSLLATALYVRSGLRQIAVHEPST